MRASNEHRALRLEEALHLLPDVGGLTALRARLVATSRENPRDGRYDTVGKRIVSGDLRDLAASAASADAARAVRLCETAVEALRSHERGDRVGAARSLLDAGEAEEREGRLEEAGAWYRQAVRWSHDPRHRVPEMEALLHEGGLDLERGRWSEAERSLGRCYVLADAEGAGSFGARACRAMGDLQFARADARGAEMWFRRGVERAGAGRPERGALLVGLACAVLGQDRLQEAESLLEAAQEALEDHPDPEVAGNAVRALLGRCALEEAQDDSGAALEWLRAAGALIEAAGGPAALDVQVHANASRILTTEGRLPEADLEARRAETAALRPGCPRLLARAYLAFGRVREMERDETGFVFFEAALELLRGSGPAPNVEAEIYLAYGRFRAAFGHWTDATIYWGHARDLWRSLGAGARAASAEELMAGLSGARNGIIAGP